MMTETRDNVLAELEKLRAPQGYLFAGMPHFKRLFGRDSCITALQVLDDQPDTARATLKILARYQGRKNRARSEEEPGKILHEHYVGGLPQKLYALANFHSFFRRVRHMMDWGYPYYGSIDATAWWMILLGEYYKKTGDDAFVKEMWMNVKHAIRWTMDSGNINDDIFIEYKRKNPKGLYDQSWKDAMEIQMKEPIAKVEVQGYYYAAYVEMGKLSREVIGDEKLAAALEERAAILKKAFNERFWMEDAGYYAFAIDGDGKQVEHITSDPGHCLFTGIIDDQKVERFVARLFEPDMATKYGIRTQSEKDEQYHYDSYHHGSIWPHDNWVIYMGLKKLGYEKEAQHIRDGLVAALNELGYIPELFGVEDGKIKSLGGANKLQAWASGSIINIMREKK
ncbi:amylo-alpha-1,6-glucosidase [Patescibacteria group bacterium]